jgi:hypothetical protein
VAYFHTRSTPELAETMTAPPPLPPLLNAVRLVMVPVLPRITLSRSLDSSDHTRMSKSLQAVAAWGPASGPGRA